MRNFQDLKDKHSQNFSNKLRRVNMCNFLNYDMRSFFPQLFTIVQLTTYYNAMRTHNIILCMYNILYYAYILYRAKNTFFIFTLLIFF